MGKCIAYTAGAITFLGIGALVTGLALYFVYPNMRNAPMAETFIDEYRSAQCELQSPSGGVAVSGTIHFTQQNSDSDVYITAEIAGLTSGPHGFHIHEFGVDGGDCTKTGSHYNPDELNHGGPDSDIRHVGDLGNIQSVGEGTTVAMVNINDNQVTLSGSRSVLGRAIVIHAGEDDLGASGDSAGAAGGRVACCNIYIAPSPTK